jgi:hypothetical protein
MLNILIETRRELFMSGQFFPRRIRLPLTPKCLLILVMRKELSVPKIAGSDLQLRASGDNQTEIPISKNKFWL